MEAVKFSLVLERETLSSVWKRSKGINLIDRPITDIHNDYHNKGERWIHGGNNDLYKAHASLSPDGLSMYLYIGIDAQLKADAFNAALYLILNTKMFGSYVSRKLWPSCVSDEVATRLAAE